MAADAEWERVSRAAAPLRGAWKPWLDKAGPLGGCL